MKITRIQIPKDKIIKINESIEEYGGPFVELENGLFTDVYQDEDNLFWSITNDKRIINYLGYNNFEVEHKDLLLKFSKYNQDSKGFVNLKVDVIYREHYKTRIDISFSTKDKVSISSFEKHDGNNISFSEHKEIDNLCNFFLKDFEGIETAIFSVDTEDSLLIMNLNKLGYIDVEGFINVNDNLQKGEYLLEKKI